MAKKYKRFPESCVGCEHATPTGMCRILFNEDWANGGKIFFHSKANNGARKLNILFSKRRDDCPLNRSAEQPQRDTGNAGEGQARQDEQGNGG